MGGEVDHVDAHALVPPVGFEPVEVHLVGTLPYLCKHVGQHCERSRPKVDLEPVEVARSL